MSGRLSHERISQLVSIAVQLELYNRRSALLLTIPHEFVSNMRIIGQGGTLADQLKLDLNTLNEMGKLQGDIDPLKIWLTNAYGAAGGVQEAEAFQHALGELQPPASHSLQPLSGATWLPRPDHPGYREAVIHTDTHVPAQFLEDGQMAGKSVARVSVTRFDQGKVNNAWDRAKGTGWLIGPRLLITAYHLVNARVEDEPAAEEDDFAEQALNAQVTFGYDHEGEPGTVIGVTDLLGYSFGLDYAILLLEADPHVLPLRLARDMPTTNKDSHPPLNVITHLQGQPKMLACRNVLATTLTGLDTDLGYLTDADLRASGAPVFNDAWCVVAMHRATAKVNQVTFQGLSTAWANVGTRITDIRRDLQRHFPDVWRSISRAQRAQVPLSVVPSTTTPSAQRLRESIGALRSCIRSTAQSYEESRGLWVWEKDPLHRELDGIDQQLKAVSTWLADAELSRSGLRDSLNRHHPVADRFVQRLGDLETAQTPTRRSLRRQEFERAGESLLELLVRIQEQLLLLGPGDNPPGPS